MPPSLLQVEKDIAHHRTKTSWQTILSPTLNGCGGAGSTSGGELFFTNALTKLTVKDAESILKGAPDAATQYFRKTTEDELREKFLPIVREATAKVGVTTAYKQLMSKAQFAAPLLGRDTVDLDSYVATKAMDGLFKMVAEEEKADSRKSSRPFNRIAQVGFRPAYKIETQSIFVPAKAE